MAHHVSRAFEFAIYYKYVIILKTLTHITFNYVLVHLSTFFTST